MTRDVEEWSSKNDNAMPRTCAVTGCGQKIDCNGFCAKHERRWKRHGDPLAGTTDRGAAQRFMETMVIPYTGDNCFAWPFGRNNHGYGVFHIRGRAVGAHVVACERVHGPRPTPKHEVAHTCGNGHLLCCNPRHLRWATKKENFADKLTHGTHNRGIRNHRAKLDPDKVIAIRKLLGEGSHPQHRIAANFGVSQMIISKISRGLLWGWLP